MRRKGLKIGIGILLLTAAVYLLIGRIGDTPEYISKIRSSDYISLVDFFESGIGKSGFGGHENITALANRPAYYFEQNVPYCGGFSIAGILSAFDMHEDVPVANYMSQWGQIFGGMTPSNAVLSLARYNVQAEIRRAGKLSDEAKIQIIKDEIDAGKPVMLLVSNGYRKDGTFSQIKSQNAGYLHWITIWGYHGGGFFIYDSVVHPYQYQPVPIGNIERSNEQLLRDWANPFYLSPFLGNTYITIEVPLLEPDLS
jgi:hypothetical protein